MYSHVQLTESGAFLRLIPAGVAIEWDANNYCTAFALEADDKAAQFRVLPYYTAGQPAHDPITQAVRELTPENIEGQWTQQWEVHPKFKTQAEAEAAIAADLVTRRAAAWERIKQERDRRKYLGVKVAGHWFHSDDPSRIQQLALAMMGAAIPAGLQWKTLTLAPPPVFVEMTPALAQGIFQATAANDAAIFAAAETHRVAIEASSTPESYDTSTGWPVSIEDEAP